MSNTRIITQLIQQFEAYEAESQSASVEDFANWLLQKKDAVNMKYHLAMGNKDKIATQKVDETDNAIGILLGLMNKYAKVYSKAALENLPLNTIEEFGYLAHLSSHAQITKTALISRGMDGKTTGMDIIRRLVEHGLAKEINNPEDGRSKLLKITEKGRKVIAASYQAMGRVSKAVAGNLSKQEKQTLKSLLSKLEHHHKEHEMTILAQLRTH